MAAPGPPVAPLGGQTGTSGSISMTLPATINADDIILIWAINHQPTSVGTISWPAGFTEGQQVQVKSSVGTVNGTAGWAWKRAAGTEGGTIVAVTRTGDTGTDSCFQCCSCAIPGCVTSGDPFETPPTPNNPNAVATIDWPAATPTAGLDVLSVIIHCQGGAGTGIATPANWTEIFTTSSTSGTDASTNGDYRQITAASGSYDPANGTKTQDADSSWATFHIVFIPPAAGNNWTATPADTLGLTDQASLANTRNRSQDDGLALADAATTAQGYAQAQVDGFALTDSATPTLTPGGGGTNWTATPADGITLTDEGIVAWTADRSTADVLEFSDQLSLASQIIRSFADGLGFTDQAATARGVNRTQVDGFGLTDQATPTLTPGAGGFTRTVNDGLALTDAFTRQAVFVRSTADTVVLTDAFARQLAVLRTQTDGFVLTDMATALLGGAVVAASVSLSEAPGAAVSVQDVDTVAVGIEDASGADVLVVELTP